MPSGVASTIPATATATPTQRMTSDSTESPTPRTTSITTEPGPGITVTVCRHAGPCAISNGVLLSPETALLVVAECGSARYVATLPPHCCQGLTGQPQLGRLRPAVRLTAAVQVRAYMTVAVDDRESPWLTPRSGT